MRYLWISKSALRFPASLFHPDAFNGLKQLRPGFPLYDAGLPGRSLSISLAAKVEHRDRHGWPGQISLRGSEALHRGVDGFHLRAERVQLFRGCAAGRFQCGDFC